MRTTPAAPALLCHGQCHQPGGRVRRRAGDRKAGKALGQVRREVERRERGQVPALCGDGDPVAKATVHSPTGSWDIGMTGDKGLFGGGS